MAEKRTEKISLSAFREMLRNTRRLFIMIWQERKGLIIGFSSLVLIGSAFTFAGSGAQALLINELVRVVGGHPTGQILFYAGLFIVIGFLPSLFYSFQSHYDRLVYFYISEKFETLIIARMGEMDVALHENPKHKNLCQKVSEDGVWRINNFADRQFYLLQNVFEVVVAAIIVAISQWWVLVLLLLATIPQLIVETRYGHEVWNIHGSRAEIRRRFWDLQGHFKTVSHIVELKLFQNVSHFFQIIKGLFHTFNEEEKKAERNKLLHQTLALIISQVAIAVAAGYFIFRVIHGDMLIGTLTFVLASIRDLRQSLSGIFANLGKQYQDSLFVTDVFKLLDLPSAVEKPKQGVVLEKENTPEIIFENVSFKYPESNKWVLRDFSLHIKSGEKLALVGVNGAGKTTFVKLLCRFYDPTEGKIFVNGHDLRDIDLESWYSLLGVIFQDYAHYHFLVKEAIAVGRTSEKSTFEKIQSAAKASGSETFIEEWEKKYEQMLGKEWSEGIEPSIGQWQKLALARTFYRDPQIIILDEPTSSIDAEAEQKIFERLEKLPPDRTVILISHRFSTVRKANNICVIEDGRLSEYGSHEELLKKEGTYARLFILQAKGYK